MLSLKIFSRFNSNCCLKRQASERLKAITFDNSYVPKIRVVVGDWSGTFIDDKSNAPALAIKQACLLYGMDISLQSVKEPMGMSKVDHIKYLLFKHGDSKYYEDKDAFEHTVGLILETYKTIQKTIIRDHCELLPGVLTTLQELQKQNIKIGLTTGFPKVITDIIVAETQKQGLYLDAHVATDEVFKGRPYPDGIERNMELLNIINKHEVVKIDDSETGIQEGVNAGVWTIGLSKHSVTSDINQSISKQILLKAGADYVVDTVQDIPKVINEINFYLRKFSKV